MCTLEIALETILKDKVAITMDVQKNTDEQDRKADFE